MPESRKRKKKSSRRVDTCPTSNKQKYYKAFDAYRALNEILAKDKIDHGESRIYPCGRHFHLTSKKER